MPMHEVYNSPCTIMYHIATLLGHVTLECITCGQWPAYILYVVNEAYTSLKGNKYDDVYARIVVNPCMAYTCGNDVYASITSHYIL